MKTEHKAKKEILRAGLTKPDRETMLNLSVHMGNMVEIIKPA
jgi:hypothetical protein